MSGHGGVAAIQAKSHLLLRYSWRLWRVPRGYPMGGNQGGKSIDFGSPSLARNRWKSRGPEGQTVDAIYIASTRDETGPGASGQVQHQDDQEQLLDNF